MNALQQFIGAASLLVAMPSFAHHSMAMFDATRVVTLQGTVKQFQWTNPHCFIQLLVPQPDGPAGHPSTIEWSIEMNSPLSSYRTGYRPGTLKPGDRVSVVINPVKDGTSGGRLLSASDANGQPLPGKQPL